MRADGGRPTSRGLPPAARWATLPCPAGQGALPVCVFDAVCPAGKSAAEWRAGSWRVTEGSEVSERFAHQGLSRRAGERTSPRKERSFSRTPSPLRSPNEPLPTRNGDTPHLTVKTRPSSRKTFHIYPSMANAAHYKPRLIASAFRGEHPARAQARLPAPFLALLIPQKAISPPFPPPLHPSNHPAGRPAGSARTRSRVQTLENPFLGSGSRFPAPPSPKTSQAASPCSWACRRLLPPPPHSERNEASPPPARGAGVRRIRANGTGRRHRRPSRRGRLRRLGRSRRSGRRGRARCARSGRRRAALP